MPDMQDDFRSSDNSVDNSVDDAVIQDIITNIDRLIEEFKISHDVDDIRTISQNEFTGILKYIQFNYIRPTKCLYKYTPNTIHNNNITLMYNDYIVSSICDYYMYLCSIYNKIVNVYGFYALTGIDFKTFESWEEMQSQRPQAFQTIKRLKKEYECTLENGAQSGKNPVGFIATLNHRFGWSADNKPQLTVNITRSKNEILSSINPELLTDNS